MPIETISLTSAYSLKARNTVPDTKAFWNVCRMDCPDNASNRLIKNAAFEIMGLNPDTPPEDGQIVTQRQMAKAMKLITYGGGNGIRATNAGTALWSVIGKHLNEKRLNEGKLENLGNDEFQGVSPEEIVGRAAILNAALPDNFSAIIKALPEENRKAVRDFEKMETEIKSVDLSRNR